MKYSNYIGALAAAALIICCFFPWVYIDAIKTTISGMNTGPTNYGKPGILHIFFSLCSVILFMIPAIWAKRTNLFIGAFNFSWAVRNVLLISRCELGECPEKFFAIYALIPVAAILLVMTMLPDLKLKNVDQSA